MYMELLDDIVVFSRNIDDYFARLESLFSRLKHHGLKPKGDKCDFLIRTLILVL